MAGSNVGAAVAKSGGGFFRILFGFFGRFPRGSFAILFIVILTFGAITDAYEEKNPSVFVTSFISTFSVDGRITSEISNLREKANENEGTLSITSLLYPGFKIVGLLYLLYYLYFIFGKGVEFIFGNDSITGWPILFLFTLFFFGLQLVNASIQADITGDDFSFKDGTVWKENYPFRGVVALVKNYDLWLPSTRVLAGSYIGNSGTTTNISSNTTQYNGSAADLT